jgi:GTP-binding protein
MAPRPFSPFICASCARHHPHYRRHASTSSSSQGHSKLEQIDQFLTPSPRSSSLLPPTTTAAPARQSQYHLPSSVLSYHWDTSPAARSTLRAANTLFTATRPAHLWTRSTFRETPESSLPEVAFLGRSNVGKSSLLNAMLGAKELARTSGRPGRTKTMNAFLVGGDGIRNSGRGKLVVLDMPGYGKGARAEWGVEVVKYLRGRKQYVIPPFHSHHLFPHVPEAHNECPD